MGTAGLVSLSDWLIPMVCENMGWSQMHSNTKLFAEKGVEAANHSSDTTVRYKSVWEIQICSHRKKWYLDPTPGTMTPVLVSFWTHIYCRTWWFDSIVYITWTSTSRCSQMDTDEYIYIKHVKVWFFNSNKFIIKANGALRQVSSLWHLFKSPWSFNIPIDCVRLQWGT